MKLRILLAVLVFIFVVAGCSDSKETRMQRFLIQGNEKIGEQEYEQAEKYFQSALKLDSCFADALNNLGTVEHRRNNSGKAIEYYSRAIQCNPDFSLAYFNRANVYYESNQLKKALSDLGIVEKTHPDSAALFHMRGLVFWKMHENKDAIRDFSVLLSRKESEKDMLINIGTLYSSLKNYDSGRYFLRKALTLDPSDANAFNAMAILDAEAGDPAKGMEWIDKALTAKPDDPYFLNNKGYILLLMGKHEQALPLINQSIVLDPHNGWAYRNKGIYFYLTDKTDDAIRLLTQAERIDPLIDQLFYWLGRSYVKKGELTEGCQYLQKAFQRNQLTEKELISHCRE